MPFPQKIEEKEHQNSCVYVFVCFSMKQNTMKPVVPQFVGERASNAKRKQIWKKKQNSNKKKRKEKLSKNEKRFEKAENKQNHRIQADSCYKKKLKNNKKNWKK